MHSPQVSLRENVLALISGSLFGLGLGISQMIDRNRVLGFLDVAGKWDPTLAFVMGGAVLVTLISFRVILKRAHPLWAPRFYLPTQQDIDRPLLLGAGLFGIGWGLAGYCPGPALTATVLGQANPFLFVGAMVTGSWTYQWLTTRTASSSPAASPVLESEETE